VVLVAVIAWLSTRGGGGGGGGGDEPRLAESEIVVTQTDEDGNPRSVALDTETGESRDLGGHLYMLPTVSWDREWIAYLKIDDDGRRVPHIVRVDGSEDHPMLDAQATEGCPSTNRPAWSPDDGFLAFVCRNADLKNTGLWVVDREGALVRELVDSSDPVEGPTWGGDGLVYYVSRPASGEPSTIWSVKADGTGEPQQLTSGEDGWDSHPDWSDGGLLFLRSPEADAPGGIVVRQQNGDVQEYPSDVVESPTWSPDGSRAVWIQPSGSDSTLPALWISLADGNSEELPINGRIGPPAWGSR